MPGVRMHDVVARGRLSPKAQHETGFFVFGLPNWALAVRTGDPIFPRPTYTVTGSQPQYDLKSVGTVGFRFQNSGGEKKQRAVLR